MRRRSSVVMLGGWLCSTAIVAAAASTARASCGDWLAHLGDHDSAVTSLSADQSDSSSAKFVDFPTTASRPDGCHGPHCHQAPLSPLPLVPVVLTTGNDPLGLSAVANTSSAKSWRYVFQHKARVAAAQGFFPSPDHPPRIS